MSFALSVLASLAAGLLLPSLVHFLNNARNHWFAEVAEIAGDWVVAFTEPDGTAQTIEAHLERFGTRVRGTGHILGHSEDPFSYKGTLKRQSLAGDFWRSRNRVLAGTGAFLLKISADERSMSGHCSWYDTGTDGVWTSKYDWKKKASG